MNRLLSRLLLLQLLTANVVVANSQATASWISSQFPRLRDRTSVVYNAVQLPKLSAGAAPLDRLDHVDARLLVIGRLSHRKGQDVAIEALDLIRARGYAAVLDLVGGVYPGYEQYEAGLRRLVLQLGLTDVVQFRGELPDVADVLASADVLLVPSRVEPFGNVAIEGLLAGVPVVASNVGGLPEALAGGRHGTLVSAGDAEALANAVLALIRQPELVVVQTREAAEFASSTFTSEQYENGLLAAVSATLAGV